MDCMRIRRFCWEGGGGDGGEDEAGRRNGCFWFLTLIILSRAMQYTYWKTPYGNFTIRPSNVMEFLHSASSSVPSKLRTCAEFVPSSRSHSLSSTLGSALYTGEE